MRYLSKIIFLNSAHIPLAEIKIDGNTHFAGTQGVGKSTIQRAILFFYNADQMKLGISKEKKSFADYYFAYPNSYIVYEVMRDGNAYMVMTFMNRGRISFRFIDTAYRREFFIDENNEVYSDWTSIRKHIPSHVNASSIVDTYEDYRNIIYGNHSATKQQFRKYAITESNKYQNIPRTIQNVFLNSKLDAEVIKKTIIDSMTDMELDVSIDSMRGHIADFGQQYDDVMLWEKKDDKGVLYVKRDANNVVHKYNDLKSENDRIQELCGKILHARQRDEQMMPQWEEKQNILTAEDLRINGLIKDEQQKYDNEKGEINKTIGELEGKLKSIAQKKAQYQEMKIEEIIALVESEQQVKESMQHDEEILKQLTQQHKNIKEKYDAIINALEQKFNTFQNGQEQKKNDRKENMLNEKGRFQQQKEDEQKRIRDEHKKRGTDIQTQIDELNEELSSLREKKTTIELTHKYGAELSNVQKEIETVENGKEKCECECKHLKEKHDVLLSHWNTKEQHFEEKIQNVQQAAEKRIAKLKEEIEAEQSILDKQDGSFFAWLEENKSGWEENIAKVANEEILYNTSLNPTDNGTPGDFFGVEIDLSDVERKIRTPEEIRQCIDEKKTQIEEIKKELQAQIETITSEKDSAHQQYAEQSKQISSEITNLEVTINQAPAKLTELKAKALDWQRKEKEYKEKQLEENDKATKEINRQKAIQKQEQSENYKSRDQKLETLDNEYKQKAEEAEKQYETYCKTIDEQTSNKLAEKTRQKANYLAERDNELAGKGVDTAKVTKIEHKIEEEKKTLHNIENNRQHYYNYKQDKEELFDKESNFRRQKEEEEEKIKQLDAKYQNIKAQHQQLKAANDTALKEVKDQIALINEGQKELNKLLQIDLCPAELKDATATQHKNDDTCKWLAENLNAAVYRRKDKETDLTQAVNVFSSHFSTKNTFSFKTNLNSTEEYNTFAENLSEFLATNHLQTYKDLISQHYCEILQRISKEMGYLMQNSSDIEKTINEINRDFESSNFAGVIKKIELKMEKSTDQLIQLLLRIQNFCDEHAFDLGEANIFSSPTEHAETSKQTIDLLFKLKRYIEENPTKRKITLNDTFNLQFRIQENDNDTNWVEKISNVGSDGTDILVKAMVNIMLINVFKKKMSRKADDYQLHCMMDEIGKLHPANVKGILDFANKRNIFLINSSPISYTASDYRYNYILEKDEQANTRVKFLMAQR